MKKVISLLAAAVLIVAAAGCTNEGSQPDETSRPTESATQAAVATTAATDAETSGLQSTTRKPFTTRAPIPTAASYTEPEIDYGGTLGTEEDCVSIASHTVSLSHNNTFVINMELNIIACSGKTNHLFIGYDCFDAEGNKINSEPVKTVVSIRQGEKRTVSLATAPINTVKIVFKSI